MTKHSLLRTLSGTAGVLAMGLLLLTGCGGNPSGTTASSPTTTATASPASSIGGQGHETMPEDIPLFQHATLQGQQATTLNGRPATTWRYLITTIDVTTEQVLGFYQRQMPARGWVAMQMPMEAMQGLYSDSAMAYQHDDYLCAIAAGTPSSNPHQVELLITVTN